MKEMLSEEEMRQALFGTASEPTTSETPDSSVTSDHQHVSKSRKAPASLTPKLRVTLRVTRDFEGATELFTYDANTLSTLIAEQEAKAEAKKKKFKYFELISIKPIE
ncbi:hypothetical protein [Pseudomonas mandelii]|uniref:Uncharacterized protein n=1 Tax=Pseudomonas mandelii TaxID=75612 RepID=A0A502ID15_9PSED|nr:hypothetical protein [Pseudomonas mandelii]TPG84797.1 hypothetical protein EAH74_12305 [Pseudomonas mandelii]